MIQTRTEIDIGSTTRSGMQLWDELMAEVSHVGYNRPYAPYEYELSTMGDAWLVLLTEYYRACWIRRQRHNDTDSWVRGTAWDGWLKQRSELVSNPAYVEGRKAAYKAGDQLELNRLIRDAQVRMSEIFGGLA
jgi:hypothetical protein